MKSYILTGFYIIIEVEWISGCETLKRRILIFLIIVSFAALTIFLYQRQLGAVSFFALAIFFFSMAYNQSTDPSKKKRKRRQRER
jgi:hypothetical protein